jgi:hypothetical protein
MPTLECTTRRADGVTLVACRLSNDRDTPCRVRLDPAPDAVAPPRKHGLPAAGWTDGRYETVLPASATVGVGFATPERPDDPPASVTLLAEDAAPDADPTPATVAGAVRSLPDPRPPRAAVRTDPGSSADGAERTTPPVERADRPDRNAVPPAVAAWLARVERRADRKALRAVADRAATARRRIDAREP